MKRKKHETGRLSDQAVITRSGSAYGIPSRVETEQKETGSTWSRPRNLRSVDFDFLPLQSEKKYDKFDLNPMTISRP